MPMFAVQSLTKRIPNDEPGAPACDAVLRAGRMGVEVLAARERTVERVDQPVVRDDTDGAKQFHLIEVSRFRAVEGAAHIFNEQFVPEHLAARRKRRAVRTQAAMCVALAPVGAYPGGEGGGFDA